MQGADQIALRDVLARIPGVPCRDDTPVFEEPWQAQAFALTLSLQQKGVFTWSDWAAALGQEIKAALATGDPDDGTTYYRHWMAALEKLVAAKGLASPEALDRTARAWGKAADRTPHGDPIVLEAKDFA